VEVFLISQGNRGLLQPSRRRSEVTAVKSGRFFRPMAAVYLFGTGLRVRSLFPGYRPTGVCGSSDRGQVTGLFRHRLRVIALIWGADSDLGLPIRLRDGLTATIAILRTSRRGKMRSATSGIDKKIAAPRQREGSGILTGAGPNVVPAFLRMKIRCEDDVTSG